MTRSQVSVVEGYHQRRCNTLQYKIEPKGRWPCETTFTVRSSVTVRTHDRLIWKLDDVCSDLPLFHTVPGSHQHSRGDAHPSREPGATSSLV